MTTIRFFQVKSKLETAARKANIPPTNEAMYEFLIHRVRENMHIIVGMSPIGEEFRNRLRQYPAIINCTTIDWFSEWPEEALLEVAVKFISDVNFVETITGETLVSCFKLIYQNFTFSMVCSKKGENLL